MIDCMTDYDAESVRRMKKISADVDAADSTWAALKVARSHIHVLIKELSDARSELAQTPVQAKIGRLVEQMGLETRITNYGWSFTVYDGNIHGTGTTPLEAFDKYAEKRERWDLHEAEREAQDG